MDYFPIFCQLQNKACLLVGGGEVAERKARLLLNAGALVTVNACEFTPQFHDWAEQGRLSLVSREFVPELLAEKWLVIAATDQVAVNAFVYQSANQQRVFCNVVVYDRLVSDEVMNLVRRDAERIFVGKESGRHSVPQDQINQILLQQAQQGKRVVRLKGGDPFIFGRGGEELETLAEYDIPFSVVPGITAASGCSAYSGIPLTHRDHAQSVRLITGHAKKDSQLDWANLAAEKQTLVFYMGLSQAAEIQQQLIQHGMPAATPVALVENGTSRHQRVVSGELNQLALLSQQVCSPSLIIVGSVVSLREKLNWFSSAEHGNAKQQIEKVS